MRILQAYRNVRVGSLSGKLLRRRWLIAATISVIALFLQILEHRYINWNNLSFGFVSEILLFCIAIPLLLGTWLSLYDANSRLSQAVSQLDLKQLIRQQLTQARDWDELAITLLLVPRTFMPISSGTLVIKNIHTGEFELKSRWSIDGTSLPKDLIPPADLGHLNPTNESLPVQTVSVQKSEKNTNTYFLKLAHNDQCMGWMQFSLESNASLRPDQIQMLENIAPDMSLAIENFSLRNTNENRSRVVIVERKRLARYLHDTLAHNLAYIRLKLDQYISDSSFTIPEAAHRDLERMRDIADQSYEQIRASLAELGANPTQDLDSEIRKFAEELADRAHFEFQLTSTGEEKPLSPYLIQQVMMNIREALKNIEIHAGAKNVKVELYWQENALEVQVCDDGQGFNPNQLTENEKETHYGLKLMQEIAAELHGTLDVSSRIGSGTVIRFRIPIE